MRAAILTTHTNNTPAFYDPLRTIGHDIHVFTYDLMAANTFGHLPRIVDACHPDFVVLIGAHRDYHPLPVVPTSILSEIGAKHKLIHMCCDGAEPVWWPILQEYHNTGRFALQVNIDGVRTGPIGEHGLTLLSPFDPSPFPTPPRPWSERSIELGFAGSPGAGTRATIANELHAKGLMQIRWRVDPEPSDQYREFLCRCKYVWNHSATGSGLRMHVKGRALEVAYAGALLFEQVGSPLTDWFVVEEDFITYTGVDDIEFRVNWYREHNAAAQAMAKRFREKMLKYHSPEVFWSQVFEQVGLGSGKKYDTPKQPSFRPYSLADAVHIPPGNGAAQPPSPTIGYDHGKLPPQLLVSANDHNIVLYDGSFYVIPQKVGTVHLNSPVDRTRPGVRKFNTEKAARQAVGLK